LVSVYILFNARAVERYGGDTERFVAIQGFLGVGTNL
jgi:hypothetical protein